MRCPWRECMLMEIVEAISGLHLDTYSVQSCTNDGVLALSLKSKLRGGSAVSAGMIKQTLQKDEVNAISKTKVSMNYDVSGEKIRFCTTRKHFRVDNGHLINHPRGIECVKNSVPGAKVWIQPMVSHLMECICGICESSAGEVELYEVGEEGAIEMGFGGWDGERRRRRIWGTG
ncbi:hypothetical protein ACLOJK_006406 [Asimina triloba]